MPSHDRRQGTPSDNLADENLADRGKRGRMPWIQRSGLVLAAAWCLGLLASSARAQPVCDAYAWPTSVLQGDTVSIFISCSQPTVAVQIIRYGATVTQYAYYDTVTVGLQAVPDSAYFKGCNWTPTLRIPIPDNWPSGVYAARIFGVGSSRHAMFVVKQKNPGSQSRILYMLSLTTMQAYNYWGGKSLYPFNSTNGVPSTAVSLRRPFAAADGRGNFVDWAMKFIEFIESRGYSMEYCTSLDIDQSTSLPMHYGVVISAGHDEYWSRPMRNSLEAHVARGGSLLLFGGNTCWWQIRFQGGDQIVCYKSTNDPLNGVVDSLVTVRWFDAPVLDPENSLTGASFRNGGYVNFGGYYPADSGYGGYLAYNTNHWAFAGTQFSDGDTLGRSEAIVGYETDGALFNWVNGEPVTSGGDGTPLNYTILGVSPAKPAGCVGCAAQGMATMGLYEAPGLVFNACTTGWPNGLATNAAVQQITVNIVDRALSTTGNLDVPTVRRFSETLRVHVQPNPSHGWVSIEWSASVPAGVRLAIFDVSGSRLSEPVVRTTAAGAFAMWNACDRWGRPAPPGLYFAELEGVGVHAAARFTLLR